MPAGDLGMAAPGHVPPGQLTTAFLALVVAVPLVLFLMHRIGDLMPALITLGTAAFVIFVLPRAPGSPVACLTAPKGCASETQLDWLIGLAFVLPAAAACAYKARRGDRAGVTGTRPVFRRRRW